MTAPRRTDSSALEAALADVHATLAELLVAAHDQHAAVVAHDREQLERVTLRQELLSARLARVERARIDVLAGQTLEQAIASLPAEDAPRVAALNRAIASAVRELQRRHSRTSALLERSVELANQTIQFLQKLIIPQNPAYGPQGLAPVTCSLLVDRRA